MVEALDSYDRGYWFEPSNRQGFSSFSFCIHFFNAQTDLLIGIHGIYDQKLFDKKTLPPNQILDLF